jgi:Mce-associated membrane protein
LTKATTGQARGLIALTLVVLTALGVLVAGVLVYRAYHPTDEPLSLSNSGQPIPSDSLKHEVVAVAEQFCLRMDAVDGADVEGYKKRVSELLTTKQKAKFDTTFAEFEKLGVSKELKGKGTILSSGVADLDSDSATVLVAHDSTLTDPSGTTDRHYRWTVALRKVAGDWLVDDFTPVS